MKFCFLQFILVLFTIPVFATSNVSECQERPDFSQGQTLSNLPPLIFVGRSATYYVENKTTGLKIWGEQSFKTGESRLVCASAGQQKSGSFSIYAPTLLDLTGEHQVGNSFWQFHMTEDLQQFGLWNQKSRILSKNSDFNKFLSELGAQAQLVQTSHDQYELLISKEVAGQLEILAIHFDAILETP